MTDLLKHRILTLRLREDAPFPSETKATIDAIQKNWEKLEEKQGARLTLIRPLHIASRSVPVGNDDSFDPEVA